MAELKFEIKKEIAVISEGAKGWTKEANIVSWNGRDAKMDLRDWSENHEKCGKGITLTTEEVRTVYDIFGTYLKELDEDDDF